MEDELDAERAGGTVQLTRGRRARAAASVPRELVRTAYRDPEHLCERMTLFASHHLADSARDWAAKVRGSQPDGDTLEIAEGLGSQSARIARIGGAVAGTPFYVALIPGYINYLWQEIRMTMRLAALYGRDPGTLRTAAEVLTLRGVYPTVDAAQAGLIAVQGTEVPPKPEWRRPARLWVRSVRRLLVFGGFLSPSRETPGRGTWAWFRDAAGLLAGAGVWVVTWFFPLTFMIAMAWGCHSHSRRLFKDALYYYGGQKVHHLRARDRALALRRHTLRQFAHGAALSVSIIAPVGFLVYATWVRNHVGINGISSLGVLVAVSLVVAAGVYGARR